MTAKTVYLALSIALSCAAFSSAASSASPLEEWKAVSKPVRACVQVAAQGASTSLEAIIAAGIRPSEPNFAQLIARCATLTTPLRQEFPCVLKDTSGNTVDTLCREAFAVMENGQWHEVSPEEAMRYNILENRQIATMNYEAPTGASRRLDDIAAALASDPAVDEVDIDTEAEQSQQAVDDPSSSAETLTEVNQPQSTFAADWLIGDWCDPEFEKLRAEKPDLKPFFLRCTREQGCGFSSDAEPWDSVEWTSTGPDSAAFSQSSYGQEIGRQVLNVPEGVNGASYQCEVTRIGQSEMSQICNGGLYGEEKQGTADRYVRCAGSAANAAKNDIASVKDTPALPLGNGLFATRTYSGTFYCLGDVYKRDGTRLLVGDPTYGVDAVETLLSIGGDTNPYALEAFQKGAYNCQLEQWSLSGSDLFVERSASSRQGLIVRLGNRPIWGFVTP